MALHLPLDECCRNPSGLQCDREGFLRNSDATVGSFVVTGISSTLIENALPIQTLIANLMQEDWLHTV